MTSNTDQLLDMLNKSDIGLVSKGQLVNIAMHYKHQNDVIKNLVSELTVDLFKENPYHPRFAEFSEADRNRLRVVKFGGRIS